MEAHWKGRWQDEGVPEEVNGKIYFKTDDDNLFEDSIRYFEQCSFEIEKITRDLKNEPDFWENIETEHEKMFADQGIKIKALIAKKTKQHNKILLTPL